VGLLSSGELGRWETGTQGLHTGVFFLVSGKTVADKSSMLLLVLQGSSGQLAQGGDDGGPAEHRAVAMVLGKSIGLEILETTMLKTIVLDSFVWLVGAWCQQL
jgi:hypothetical protein